MNTKYKFLLLLYFFIHHLISFGQITVPLNVDNSYAVHDVGYNSVDLKVLPFGCQLRDSNTHSLENVTSNNDALNKTNSENLYLLARSNNINYVGFIGESPLPKTMKKGVLSCQVYPENNIIIKPQNLLSLLTSSMIAG